MLDPDFATATWPTNLSLTLCDVCDSRYLLPPALPPFKCPTCFEGTLIEIEAEGQPNDPLHHYAPELFIPFTVSQPELAAHIQQFAGRIWFAPNDLKPEMLLSRLQRLYLPMWLVDSGVEALWQAEVGFNYEVVSHRDQFDQNHGGWHSQQITEQRIRWEPRLGRLKRIYHNMPAPALEQHVQVMARLGQYDLTEAVPFQPEALEQAVIHLPDRPPTDAWPDTIPAFHAAAAEECRQASRADHLRGYRWTSDYRDQHWTLLLLPVYTTYYTDDDSRPQPILIHGRTGRLSGPTRASMKRARYAALMIVIVATALFILSLILGGISFIVPPLIILAGISLLGALIIGMLAITPIIVVWQYNRNQSNGEREAQ